MSGSPSRPAPTTRLRRGRLVVAVCSLTCTMAVAAGALGLVPTPQALDVAVAETPADDHEPLRSAADGAASGGALLGAALDGISSPAFAAGSAAETATPPPRSGHGQRVVFDEASQHVWLIDEHESVLREYPVSGSVTDNLDPGVYEVYSRSRHATSFDLDSTMEYMVRFTQGSSAAIGFHSIPVNARGRRLQTITELGTPQSHGCIRQRRGDAIALWRFARLGTTVVVV